MATVGAVLLSLICALILQVLFGFFGGLLAVGIESTTGIIWLPLVIVAAMKGAGVFGGVTISLRLIKRADPARTFMILAVILSVLAGMTIMEKLLQGGLYNTGTEIVFDGLSLLAALLGAKWASVSARDEWQLEESKS